MSNSYKDSKLLSVMEKIFDSILLSIYWIIGCIPIITIGTSTIALYHGVNVVLHKGESHASEEFWKCFKNKFKIITPTWLVFLAVGIIFVLDLQLTGGFRRDNIQSGWLYWVFWGLCAGESVWLNYIFAYQSRYKGQPMAVVKQSIRMAIKHFPRTLMMLVVFGLAGYVLSKWFFMIFIIPTVVVWVYNIIFDSIFYKQEQNCQKE